MKRFALDTESEYSDEISLTTMGPWHYVRATNNYLLTVAGEDGYQYVGSPKDFDWSILEGAEVALANAPYDLTVLEWLNEKGDIKLPKFSSVDVLDLARYLGRPGSLKGASESLLGIEMSKKTRNNMKGKKWDTMTPEFKQEVMDYALKDAKLTLQLWLEHGDKWPWYERELSRLTMECCMAGLPIDVERAKEYAKHLKRLIWDAEQIIPWADGEDAKILSPKALAEECRKVGITPPKSLAQDSEECKEWEDTYGEQYPWVGAMRDWRRCNMLLAKVEAIIRRTKPDGWMPYGLKYAGAIPTLRWSGDSGVNIQNLPKKELYGVNLRSLIQAPEGHKLVVADLSQIEPRCLAKLAGDTKLLEFIKQSDDLYDAQARAWGLHDGPEPLRNFPDKRHLIKGLNLGLGYMMGASKFSEVAKVSQAEAERLTKMYRSKNAKTVQLWKTLERALRQSAGRDFAIELPSGREMVYQKISVLGDGASGVICRMGKMMRQKLFAGRLVENGCQGFARDVFSEKLLNIEAAGIRILFTVHDEVVCLSQGDRAEEDLKKVLEIMHESPEWAADLPLAAEGHITERYTK